MNERPIEMHDTSARTLAAAVQGGALTAGAVAEHFIERVQRLNPALNAIVQFDPARVRAEAAAVAQRLQAGDVLPLAGVPVTIKDNVWVQGYAQRQGSLLYEGFVAPRDAWVTARLRALGAVVLGITNCSEFACKGVTTNLVYGPTRHPLDSTLTPGGSSGGAVAALAAGLGLLAIGTDAGGSIRRPAAHTGLVGLKPSPGLIPHPWGFAEPNYGLSVIGLLARSVADCAWAFDHLQAFDAADPSAPALPTGLTVGIGNDTTGLTVGVGNDTTGLTVGIGNDTTGLTVGISNDTTGLTVGIGNDTTGLTMGNITPPPRSLRIGWSPRLGCDFAVDDDVAAALQARVNALRAQGWDIADADPAWPEGTREYPLIKLQHAGLHALYGSRMAAERERIDPDLAAQIDAGAQVTPADVAFALRLRESITRALDRYFDRSLDGFDLLLTPTTPVTAWPLSQLGPPVIGGRPAGPRGHAAFTPLFNYCGVPALSVPAGLVRGLPVGLQVVAPRYEDARVLRFAAVVEALGA